LRIEHPFYVDMDTKKVVRAIPGLASRVKHTQGPLAKPVELHLASILRASPVNQRSWTVPLGWAILCSEAAMIFTPSQESRDRMRSELADVSIDRPALAIRNNPRENALHLTSTFRNGPFDRRMEADLSLPEDLPFNDRAGK
jgi:hypothetical protein